MTKCWHLIGHLPVQDEDGGDGGPEDGAQPAAAQAHLQPSGDTQEVFM